MTLGQHIDAIGERHLSLVMMTDQIEEIDNNPFARSEWISTLSLLEAAKQHLIRCSLFLEKEKEKTP